MPVVPVLNENQVERRPMTNAKFAAADFGAAGERLALAGRRAGAALSDAADGLDQINEQLAQAGARELDSEYVRRRGEIRSAFLSQQGLNAGVERPKAEKSLGDLRDELVGRATTPRMKRMLEGALGQRLAADLADFDGHARAQMTEAERLAVASRMALSSEDAVAAPSEASRKAALATAVQETAALGKLNGWAPERIKVEALKLESEVHRRVALNMIDADDVDAATKYLEQNRDRINAADEAVLASALKAPLQAREARGDADLVMGGATAVEGGSVNYQDPLRGAGRSPVAGGEYGARRDYGAHQAVDIPAPSGSAVYSTAPGVARVTSSKNGGLTVVVDHGDGTVSKYMHLSAATIKDGDAVTPDTVIGKVGSTGRSSGPHLHWQVERNGKAVDPSTLVGKVAQSPQRHDMTELLARADRLAAKEGWSPERLERAKAQIAERVSRDETLLRRREDDARRAVLDRIDRVGFDKFTDVAQLGSAYATLSAEDRLTFQRQAAANRDRVVAEQRSNTAFELRLMATYDPERFAATDLRMYRDKLTRGEFEDLALFQGKARMTRTDPEVASHDKIWGTINRWAPDIGLDLGETKGKPRNAEHRKEALAIFDDMRATLQAVTQGKRQPTDDEARAAFGAATMRVKADGEQVRRSQVTGNAFTVPVPNAVRDRIVASFVRREGRPPSVGEVAQTYVRFKGQPGFWD